MTTPARTGRKKISPFTDRGKNAMRRLDELAVSVIKQALAAGDKNAAMFVYEHNHGKPRQGVDVEAQLRVQLSPSALLDHRRTILASDETLLLEAPAPSWPDESQATPDEDHENVSDGDPL
ncbi:MAG: hypothetical protein JRD89_08780 [Deltaproteobacteria bacterium]|nr:hypothetical protein [Deltaproteobacteria bacterium]